MIDAFAWVAAYLGAIALLIAAVHRAELSVHAREEAARNHEADRLGREVESVPVHADRMAQGGARHHVR